ncbi:hypothetical protein SAMN05518669_1064 [Variovorax sp. YR634]|nr:hypothetical protein SAMN05518669_1064 [Variovorax sp. YR634]
MLFNLEVLPAQEGDCLILQWKNKTSEVHTAVIDGGPGQVYEKSLRPRLEELAGGDKLMLDLVMISHVDNDHIVGVMKMLGAMSKEIEDGKAPNERMLRIGRLWHNTFNDILGDQLDAYYENEVTASVGGDFGKLGGKAQKEIAKKLKEKGEKADEAEHTAEDIAAVLAGHGESRSVRDSYTFLKGRGAIKYSLNAPFKVNDHPTLIVSPREAIAIEGLNMAIFGPRADEIEALQKAFDKYIKDKNLTAEAALAAYADKSVPNLSSIVALVGLEEGGNRKTILLTGDARGDKVLESLEEAGVLGDKPMFVDVLKVPHHGSNRNVDADFFERIHANTYVMSANGKYGNPDLPTVRWIVDSRKKSGRYDIVLTYPLKTIDAERKRVHEKDHPGTPWKAATMALEAYFESKKAEGYKFRVLAGDGDSPVLVKLGDE